MFLIVILGANWKGRKKQWSCTLVLEKNDFLVAETVFIWKEGNLIFKTTP